MLEQIQLHGQKTSLAGERNIPIREAVMDALRAITEVVQTWGIVSPADLEKHLHSQRKRARRGRPLGQKALAQIWTDLEPADTRVSCFGEVVRPTQLISVRAAGTGEPRRRCRDSSIPAEPAASVWPSLDSVDLAERFKRRVPVMQN